MRRYLCQACQRTISLLPEFVLPYLRSSLTVIALFLIARLFHGRTLQSAAATTPPAGGTVPAVYNAANEECVSAFLSGQIPFAGIVDTVAQVVSEHDPGRAVQLADVLAADSWARDRARELTGKH